MTTLETTYIKLDGEWHKFQQDNRKNPDMKEKVTQKRVAAEAARTTFRAAVRAEYRNQIHRLETNNKKGKLQQTEKSRKLRKEYEDAFEKYSPEEDKSK